MINFAHADSDQTSRTFEATKHNQQTLRQRGYERMHEGGSWSRTNPPNLVDRSFKSGDHLREPASNLEGER